MKSHYSEKQIKCRLIDVLLRKYPKSIIGIEVPFLSGKRWVDVLVMATNGDMIAYEVKSHFDSLRRMAGQVTDYLRTFDRLCVIVAPRHLGEAKLQLPKRAGYACLDEQTDRLLCKRPAARCGRLSKENLAQFIWKNGLCNGPADHKRTAVELRERLVAGNTCKTVHKMAVEALRARYQRRFQTFLRERSRFTHIEDLEYLTKECDSLF